MRYLTAVSTATLFTGIEAAIGNGLLRPLGPGEDPRDLGGERFGGIVVDHAAQLPLLRHGLPVVLLASMDREGIRQFRILAEGGVDVRIWTASVGELSESVLRSLTAPRAPAPAAAIVSRLAGRFGGLAADVIAACAILSTSRRSVDEVAASCAATTALVRTALRESDLVPVSNIIARFRCLHALWAAEGGRQNFWSSAGFRTLAELSAHMSQHTGAPLGPWRSGGGFPALLESVVGGLAADEENAAAG